MKIPTKRLLRFPARSLPASIGLMVLTCLGLPTAGHAQQTVLQWKCSTNAARWTDKPAVPLSDTIPVPTTTADRILVDSTHTAQVIDGWGGCFNERGWKAMEVLSANDRDALMHALFDPQTGLKLNFGRTPIGASDYAVDLYSLDETANDYSMANFSIARDQQRLIPYIKAALAIRPDLNMWAVPWSPPSWMKTNNSLVGGYIKDDDQTLGALAQYFTQYVQAYKDQGINIGMIMPQNEPNMITNYTSCGWTGVQFSKFIGYYLGPTLANAGLGTKIFLGTYNESSRGGYSYWVAPSMQDAQTQKYIAGVGCQWSADVTMNETHTILPTMKLMQTETECGNTNTNDWSFAEYQYQLAKKWFGAGASSNIIWNLVLDQTGLSTGGWAQCSPVVVNSSTGAITYTPFYYLYKHFSYFVQPGAHVATTYSTWGDKMAFANPDGSVVAVIGNSANSDYQVTLNINGKQSGVVTLPAHSFSTFTMPAPVVLSAIQQWRLQYFGTTESNGDAADNADPDGDGMTNLQEFYAGTNPKSAASFLRVSEIRASSAQGVQLSFPSVAGRTYQLECTDRLQPANWTVLQAGINGTGGLLQLSDPSAASQAFSSRFYRIRVSSN